MQASKQNHRKLTADSDGGDWLSSHPEQVASPIRTAQGWCEIHNNPKESGHNKQNYNESYSIPKAEGHKQTNFKACLQF